MKALKGVFIIGCIALTYACGSPANKENNSEEQKHDTLPVSQHVTTPAYDRMMLTGDFNGDHIRDTLYESYISSLTHKETKKEFNTDDSEALVDSVIKNKPVLRLYSSILGADTITITKESQQKGFYLLDNLGDINGDGKDEIGYMIDWEDQSNLNTYYIITLANKKIKNLLNFSVNEELNLEPKEMIDGKLLVKSISPKNIQYKFFSGSATVETGHYSFK